VLCCREKAPPRATTPMRPTYAGGPMTVGEICNREVVVVGPEAAIQEAARLMREHHVGCLVVVEEREGRTVPVGMLTDRDLVVELLALDLDPDTVCVGDVMSPGPVVAYEEDRLWDTLRRMRIEGVRRLPVVDREGALQGILALDDLLELLAGELAELARVVLRERRREELVRSRP